MSWLSEAGYDHEILTTAKTIMTYTPSALFLYDHDNEYDDEDEDDDDKEEEYDNDDLYLQMPLSCEVALSIVIPHSRSSYLP